MTGTDARAAGQVLAYARWGTRRLDAAVDLLVERREQIGAEQMARLRAVTGERKADGDE